MNIFFFRLVTEISFFIKKYLKMRYGIDLTPKTNQEDNWSIADESTETKSSSNKSKKLSKGQKKKAAKRRRKEKENQRNPSGESGFGEIMHEIKSINERITQLSVSKPESTQAIDQTYTFKVSLQRTSVWRRIKVDSNTSLNRFHVILQKGVPKIGKFIIQYIHSNLCSHKRPSVRSICIKI